MPRAATITVLVLFLSTGVWAQFEPPDLKSGKAVVRTAVILPPNVNIVKSGVKANEALIEESHQIENALAPLITSVLQERQCTVKDKTFASDALEQDSDLKYAVADLQKRFDELFPQMQKKPKDVR